MFPKKLQQKLNQRHTNNAFRQLGIENSLIDFSSNDYLGFAKSNIIFHKTHQYLLDNNIKINGASGSRLLTGNYNLYQTLETHLSKVHQTEASLIFNSGYTANIGFFSCVPQRGDFIFYDELCHASIRDGISMSAAKAYKFKHNNLEHLSTLLHKFGTTTSEIYIVTESVFSMDGDTPNFSTLAELSNQPSIHLVVDEAHALGVFGYGLVQQLGLQSHCFARLITFGKALGCHGAAILGSQTLIDYLINFCRSFIYTTALSPHSLATLFSTYKHFKSGQAQNILKQRIAFFNSQLHRLELLSHFIKSNTAIHSCIISGNKKVKAASQYLQNKGFDVKPILSPTVLEGKERLRFCLHSYNSEAQISEVLQALATFVK